MDKVSASETLDAGAEMVANRLRKNLRSIGKWANQQNHQCYRLYDADIPEYAFAIDCYGALVHLQEYQAPASIPYEKVLQRRLQTIAAVTEVLDLQHHQLSFKTRQRQRGKSQYTKESATGEDFKVTEGSARYWINLERYLDTGLFLDHRPMRRFIFEHANGKRFLNLFCYTATATVQAALGGAASSLSIDLSNTYLDWARRNFILNKLDKSKHRLIKKDCVEYLLKSNDKFDLIFLDPPTFSNSKSTDNTLDIQRDHVELINNALGLLDESGLLVFSTNKRRFKLAQSELNTDKIQCYTRQSIDRDFQRNASIHQVWLINR
jgi:23S rRNA (guanine2445-N2)-methyltransferase / 23S rRNA (guanine2069-N7)-methyltransferase